MTKTSYLAVVLCSFCPALAGQPGSLIVALLDKSPQVVERSDIAKLPHKTVKVKGSGSKPSVYSGVPLKELLEYVGSVAGTDLWRDRAARIGKRASCSFCPG